jgi:hypothetical protein
MSATVVATQVIAPPQSQPTPAHVAASTAPAAEKVPFTLSDLRAAIPPQCLVKDTWRSIGYMLRDFAFIAIMYAIYPYINAHDGAYNPCQFCTEVCSIIGAIRTQQRLEQFVLSVGYSLRRHAGAWSRVCGRTM